MDFDQTIWKRFGSFGTKLQRILKDTHVRPLPRFAIFQLINPKMHFGFPIFPLAILPARALFMAILSRWRMGHHVVAADKRWIAFQSNYVAAPASIKLAPSGRSASAASRSTEEEHSSWDREELSKPYRIPTANLVTAVLNLSGMSFHRRSGTLWDILEPRDI